VLDAFKDAYVPLRQELHRKVEDARHAITDMSDYNALALGDRTTVRVEYLSEGKPFQEVSLPELRDEQQLLAANAEYSIAHMRAALAALESQVSDARARVIDLRTAQLDRAGKAAKMVPWKPTDAFAGKHFVTEADVDAVLDPLREQLKELIREGKTIQVV
jgi:hypothetical protein